MSTSHPQAGDGIVEIATDKKHVVRGRLFKGLVRGTPTSDDMDIIGVFIVENGVERDLLNGTYRLQRWYEIIRPTGIGRTGWFGVGLIGACILGLCITGIVTWNSGGWVGVAMAALVLLWMYIGTRGNFTGRIR